jgi:hypothetical protein
MHDQPTPASTNDTVEEDWAVLSFLLTADNH